MKAIVYHGPGNKSLDERPMPELAAPTDAIVKVTRTTICGTDLHILKGDVPSCEPGRILGHVMERRPGIELLALVLGQGLAVLPELHAVQGVHGAAGVDLVLFEDHRAVQKRGAAVVVEAPMAVDALVAQRPEERLTAIERRITSLSRGLRLI